MEQTTVESALHVYEVGVMSEVAHIKAPSAGAAAMYFGLYLIRTNNPFMAVCYSEDGKPWNGDSFWVHPNPDEAHVKMVAGRVKAELERCSEVDGD